MKSLKSVTPIATVATAFSCGAAGAESITVKMESVREDSVEHLFQPSLMRAFGRLRSWWKDCPRSNRLLS